MGCKGMNLNLFFVTTVKCLAILSPYNVKSFLSNVIFSFEDCPLILKRIIPDIAVPKQCLDRAYIIIGLKKVGGKAVPEGMGGYLFCEFRPLYRLIKRLLNVRLMKMIPSKLLLIRNGRKRLLRQEPLPYEILCGCGIFLFEQFANKQAHKIRPCRSNRIFGAKIQKISDPLLIVRMLCRRNGSLTENGFKTCQNVVWNCQHGD